MRCIIQVVCPRLTKKQTAPFRALAMCAGILCKIICNCDRKLRHKLMLRCMTSTYHNLISIRISNSFSSFKQKAIDKQNKNKYAHAINDRHYNQSTIGLCGSLCDSSQSNTHHLVIAVIISQSLYVRSIHRAKHSNKLNSRKILKICRRKQ